MYIFLGCCGLYLSDSVNWISLILILKTAFIEFFLRQDWLAGDENESGDDNDVEGAKRSKDTRSSSQKQHQAEVTMPRCARHTHTAAQFRPNHATAHKILSPPHVHFNLYKILVDFMENSSWTILSMWGGDSLMLYWRFFVDFRARRWGSPPESGRRESTSRTGGTK